MPLSHADLLAHVAAKARALADSGIGREDRIAIALPPGPEAALAFLAAATCGIAAPLNPACSREELSFHLQDLSARVLILPPDGSLPARSAARELGISIVDFGIVEFGAHCRGGKNSRGDLGANADDLALILHTSGTTSRPKKVPLTHANLCESAHNIAATLRLREEDVSLSIMPLFHIHGLACLLAALGAGGSCVCVSDPRIDQFPRWLEAWKPTWLSAAPTFLQAILDIARDQGLGPCSLRLIRSSSAPLPFSVAAGLENILGIPVIDSYGMTEAAHQMASNPLPPGMRKAGSVGLPAGPRIAILDDAGAPLDAGRIGEVAVAGGNVTRGYEGNTAANATAYHGEWFRTGDQGYFDADGYLFITGRLKELINRGGEKIAPREIDETLLSHPAVRQAVAFPIAHPSLGEDIVAAVVLRTDVSEAELRAFTLDRLAAFKVPSRIIVVDDLPKGSSGKIQRIGMAERLAAALTVRYESPLTDSERQVAESFEAVLRVGQVGRDDNFFALGGDSLRAMQVLVRLEQLMALELPVSLLFRQPTPALLGAVLDELIAVREIDQLARALAELPEEERASLLNEAGPPAI